MARSDLHAPRRPVTLSLNAELVAKAEAEGLDLSALADQAVAIALARTARDKLEAEVAHACRQHELYLAEYGSLADHVADYVRTEEDAAG